MKESLLLRQALSLCSSLVEESVRIEAAFFESVRILVMRLMNQGEGAEARFRKSKDESGT